MVAHVSHHTGELEAGDRGGLSQRTPSYIGPCLKINTNKPRSSSLKLYTSIFRLKESPNVHTLSSTLDCLSSEKQTLDFVLDRIP